jgi:tetratricopeptide (TPR) repeat protein
MDLADADPADLATFWKAQLAMADKSPDQAIALLEPLARRTSPLRGQVLYHLARACAAQHRFDAAALQVADCLKELPNAQPVMKLQAEVKSEIQRRQAIGEAYGKWTQLRQSADQATSDDAAVESLLALAAVERQLGAPKRSAVILEEALHKHEAAAGTPRVLQSLVELYMGDLQDPARAKIYQERITRPSSNGAAATQPSAGK